MSKIEWTNKTWNPLVGCDKISAGCKNCYAIRMAYRLMHNPKMKDKYAGTATKTAGGELNWTGKINMVQDDLSLPGSWKKPCMVFVNSMSDLFHEDVPFLFINAVFSVMSVVSRHTYQVLTKRPARMVEFFEWKKQQFKIPWQPSSNVWLGVSVEDQKAADERIHYLNYIPAAVKFLSCEPLLSNIDFETSIGDSLKWHAGGLKNCISWVIAGGESGYGSRPMHPDWVRSIRDQCNAGGVPFFFKQWGEYYTKWFDMTNKEPVFKMYHSYLHFTQKDWVNKGDKCISIDGRECHIGKDFIDCAYPVAIMNKVGKKKAGRLLDGREWSEYPKL